MNITIETDSEWFDELRDADRVVFEDRDGRTIRFEEVGGDD